ncbi:uncharacterized protein HMPREF1541_08380 [Cyphellophora europaea CBS 101466]|uniref:Yeast cell wall synthesis Kre9/Knh1-like N-terminal domain-containing protein n=1 Tax=Cyphellophora europaea (strain CBS 101466) TaxID=1220924 RepID=W2RNV5_CYPE1|nr:uncharacterized protein HMPREF1541_08380 [Cyphellophora europaea CBS 101466]ETN37389.1 hypothetical protein HMPREF1541_08380 [Cyphellophora europaea CBS 101466]
MMLTRFVLASASLLSLALAQTKIAFTSLPAALEAGDTYNITWGGGNGDPVTLTLRKGSASDLKTIETIADGVTGTSYSWEVDEDLEDADDYALQITQGQGDVNYSGLFTISGGSGSSSSSSSSSATSTSMDNSTSTTSGESSSTTNGTSSSTSTSNSTESSTTTDSSTTGSTTATTTRSPSSASETGAAQTSAPDAGSGAMQLGSSAAFAMAVLGAVVLMN